MTDSSPMPRSLREILIAEGYTGVFLEQKLKQMEETKKAWREREMAMRRW